MGRQVTLDDFLLFDEGAKKTENIKDPRVFDVNFVPDEIYKRKEYATIAREVGAYLNRGLISHILIFGGRGTGKTATVKYLLRRAREYSHERNINANFFYASAKENQTTYNILRFILNLKTGVTIKDLFDKAREALSGRCIIAIDEVDFLKDDDVLYFLSRETEAMVIAVATSPFWIKTLDQSVQSSFQPDIIPFPEYTAEELLQIFRQRAEMGLYRWDEAGLNLLAAIIRREYHGDTRYGIMALKHLAPLDRWDEASVREAIMKGIRELELTAVGSLSSDSLILLSKIISFSDGVSSSLLYKKVREELSMAKATFFSMLEDLEKKGLIAALGGKKGKPYIVTPLLHYPEIVKEELRRRDYE